MVHEEPYVNILYVNYLVYTLGNRVYNKIDRTSLMLVLGMTQTDGHGQRLLGERHSIQQDHI